MKYVHKILFFLQQVISTLRGELEDLNFRLRKVSSERDYFESTLSRMQVIVSY